jgi:hypothetical protein
VEEEHRPHLTVIEGGASRVAAEIDGKLEAEIDVARRLMCDAREGLAALDGASSRWEPLLRVIDHETTWWLEDVTA